ncbi:queuosine-tRNA galactosyltransferase [Pelodytes ibericus]
MTRYNKFETADPGQIRCQIIYPSNFSQNQMSGHQYHTRGPVSTKPNKDALFPPLILNDASLLCPLYWSKGSHDNHLNPFTAMNGRHHNWIKHKHRDHIVLRVPAFLSRDLLIGYHPHLKGIQSEAGTSPSPAPDSESQYAGSSRDQQQPPGSDVLPKQGRSVLTQELGYLPGTQAPGKSSRKERIPDVSIILPIYNAEVWLDECLKSIQDQDFEGIMEVSVYNDASKDNSAQIIEAWRVSFEERGISMITGSHHSPQPHGVGFAKNQAIAQSSGRYLCFLDSDDVMMSQRVRKQYEAAIRHPTSIIGCRVRREPADATERYTRWINSLTPEQLIKQVYTSHGPTVIMPTWFCTREWFCYVGQFVEDGRGTPEDLIFFYEHLRKDGGVHRVDECLLQYRYHEQAATHSVSEDTIWKHRVKFLEEQVLQNWPSFTIWNAGKQGRKLYRSLTPANRMKVVAFCDVDDHKISKGFYTYQETEERPKPKIPVIHFTDAKPPFILCVKLDLTGGGFEENLKSLNLAEGVDFYHFN